MTLEEIEDTLPNGFHDAQIQEIAMNYDEARLTLRIKIWAGSPSSSPPERDRYRSGILTFRRVQFFAVELPQAGIAFQHPGHIWFSFGRTPSDTIPPRISDVLPQGTLCYSLFILDWFSSIHIAAAEVSLSELAEDG